MKKTIVLLISAISGITFMISFAPALAQPPVLETIQRTMISIVGVDAERSDVQGSSKPQVAIDPQTGKMVMLQRARTAVFRKLGAGIVIDASGLIVTNFHTISFANRILVKFQNGSQLPAKIVDLVPQHDFAFLKVEAQSPLTAAVFADSDQVKLGDEIINVGHSELLNKTISGGLVTGIGTNSEANSGTQVIQTNINIYHGDSGGPLLDKQGQLLGLMMAKNRSLDRSSFAIPSNKIREFYLKYLEKHP